MIFFVNMGVFFFASLYLQLVRGFAPLQIGLFVLPYAVAQLIFAPHSVVLVKRWGARTVPLLRLVLTALTLLGLVFVQVATPIWTVAALFFAQGVGTANVMPPAMDSIMSALPRQQAGVASAVASTVRQVAAALGVAVLGSAVAVTYRQQIAPTLVAVPESARGAVRESAAGAYGVADRLGPAGRPLRHLADAAFVSAMHHAALVAAVVALLGVLVVARWRPRASGLPAQGAATPTAPRPTAPRGEPDLTPARRIGDNT